MGELSPWPMPDAVSTRHQDGVLDRDLSPGDPERLLQRNLQVSEHDPLDRTRCCHHVDLASQSETEPDLSTGNRVRRLFSPPYHTTPGFSAGWNRPKIAPGQADW